MLAKLILAACFLASSATATESHIWIPSSQAWVQNFSKTLSGITVLIFTDDEKVLAYRVTATFKFKDGSESTLGSTISRLRASMNFTLWICNAFETPEFEVKSLTIEEIR